SLAAGAGADARPCGTGGASDAVAALPRLGLAGEVLGEVRDDAREDRVRAEERLPRVAHPAGGHVALELVCELGDAAKALSGGHEALRGKRGIAKVDAPDSTARPPCGPAVPARG